MDIKQQQQRLFQQQQLLNSSSISLQSLPSTSSPLMTMKNSNNNYINDDDHFQYIDDDDDDDDNSNNNNNNTDDDDYDYLENKVGLNGYYLDRIDEDNNSIKIDKITIENDNCDNLNKDKMIDIPLTERQQNVITEKYNTLRKLKKNKRKTIINNNNNNDDDSSLNQDNLSNNSLNNSSNNLELKPTMTNNNQNNNNKTKKKKKRFHYLFKNLFNTNSSSRINLKNGNNNENRINIDNDNDDYSNYTSSSAIIIKSFKWNASYRKLQRNKKMKSLQLVITLLETIPLLYNEYHLLNLNVKNINNKNNNINDDNKYQNTLIEFSQLIYNDFGYKFIFNDNNTYIIKFIRQHNITYCEDFTKNLSCGVQSLALLELEANIKDLKLINKLSTSSTYTIPTPIYVNKKILKNLQKYLNGNRSAFTIQSSMIFGGNLKILQLLDNERNQKDLEIPSILKYMIDYLIEYGGVKEEGLFRISGTTSRAKNLQNELTNLFYKYYKLNLKDNDDEIMNIFKKYNVCDIATIMKLFLRKLKPPLLTNELLDLFLMISSTTTNIKNIFIKIKLLNLLILSLDDVHRNCLNRILLLLNLVVENRQYNRINLHSISTLLAINLFNKINPCLNDFDYNFKQQLIDNNNNNQQQQHRQSLVITDGNKNHLSPFLNRKKSLSISSQNLNDISIEMEKQLEYSQNSINVLKLLINLQPILFHIPPYLDKQIKQR